MFTILVGLTDTILEWGSKWLSNEKIKLLITTNNSLSQKLIWMNNAMIEVTFKGSCLK